MIRIADIKMTKNAKNNIWILLFSSAFLIICDAIREKRPTIQKWKFRRRAIEEIAAALNAFKDSFSIIQINVDNKFLIVAHETSIQKLIESRILSILFKFI